MKRHVETIWVLVAGLMAASGCAGTEETEARGTLALALTSSDSNGTSYRLRNATFRVEGWPSVGGDAIGSVDAGLSQDAGPILTDSGSWSPPYVETLSSEDDIDSPFLESVLLRGSYEVTLEPGWFLERVDAEGATPVEAILLSASRQHAWIEGGHTSFVRFTFGVDGSLIDFFGGRLQIGIDVIRPGDSYYCDGYQCYLYDPHPCGDTPCIDGGSYLPDGGAWGPQDAGGPSAPDSTYDGGFSTDAGTSEEWCGMP